MTKKMTATLAICVMGAAVFVALLFRGDDTTGPATAAGSNSDSGDSGEVAEESPLPSNDPEATITIENFAFGESVSVAPGASVVVQNIDGAAHTVTADDDSFTTATLSPDGSEVIIAPSASGSYTFFCKVHPSMTGVLEVG